MYVTRVLRETGAELRRVASAETRPHGRLRDHVVAIVLYTVGIDLVCAALALMFEHDQKGTQIKTFGSAIFWTTTQLLTVSSQIVNPISTPARVLDVFMEIWAVSVIASLAAAVGTFLMKRS